MPQSKQPSGRLRISARQRRNVRGFTLVEIAIVLVIVSILLTSVVAGFGGYIEAGKEKATKSYLNEARTALLNFVAINGFLPCPDNDGDGAEDRDGSAGGVCVTDNGALPFSDLELEPLTPWDRGAFYVVNSQVVTTPCSNGDNEVCYFEAAGVPNVIRTTPPTATDNGTGNLTISDLAGDPVALNVIAIVGSYGGNGALTDANCDNANAPERENCDGDDQFTMDVPTAIFDDQLVWLSANTVKGRLMDAGLL